jgi:hypothetical protein
MQLGAWRRAALDFASRSENRVVFRVARVGKSLGFCRARFDTAPRQKRVLESNYLSDVLKSGCVESSPKHAVTPQNS